MVGAGLVLGPKEGPYQVLLGATAVIWVALELRQGLARRPEAVTTDRSSLMVLRAAFIGGFVAAVAIARAVPGARIQPELAASLGLILMWCGIAFRFWSFRTLGRYFTFTVQTSKDQPVITDGPYRLVRHPGYTGLLLALTGVGLFLANWAAAVGLTVLVTAGLVYRIRVEERAMLQTIGDRYRDYAATHKRLIPLVW